MYQSKTSCARLSLRTDSGFQAQADSRYVYNLSNCGDSCAKWVLKIAEQKDLTVYLRHIMGFEGLFEIQIMNTGKIVRNRAEYVMGLLEAEEMMDEG